MHRRARAGRSRSVRISSRGLPSCPVLPDVGLETPLRSGVSIHHRPVVYNGAEMTSLTDLGLTTYEAAAYQALLTRSELTSSEVAARAKIPRQRVYDVLASLEAKGLA